MVKRVFLLLVMILISLVSGCQIYKQIYGEEEQIAEPEIGDNVVYVPFEEIKVEEVSEEVVPVTEIKEEAEAVVLIVTETEKVTLKPQATDPDMDQLDFSYTSPLDENGEWQTGYGDAGEYTITVSATDGQLSTSRDVLVIVNKKEEPPEITSFSPESEDVSMEEGKNLEFSAKASDLNKDELGYIWKFDGKEVSTEGSYGYMASFDDAGSHTVKLIVSDGTSEAEQTWSLNVENVNRPPVLEKIADIKVKETEDVVIELSASDPDKEDTLTYSIDDDRFVQDDNKFTWETTYDDAGNYEVSVELTDGDDVVSQTVKITVENVNRPPVIADITLG